MIPEVRPLSALRCASRSMASIKAAYSNSCHPAAVSVASTFVFEQIHTFVHTYTYIWF